MPDKYFWFFEELREALIGNIEERLKQKTTVEELFRIRWRMV
ncbi:MAG: hypothetical protein ABII25_02720 [bacterium]